jgi:hypothetical protein
MTDALTGELPQGQLLAEQLAPPDRSVRENLTQSFAHNRLGRAVIAGLAAASPIGVEAVVPDAAQAIAPRPTAHESTTSWSHLGGDPLVRGGLHSRHDFVKLVTSGKGQAAMRLEHLSKRERSAVTKAAREGMEYNCTMHYGQHFDAMVFGINGAGIDRDVVFNDPRYRQQGASSYCLNAKVTTRTGDKITTETIRMLAPKKCGNLALINIVKRTRRVHHAPAPPPSPQPAQPEQTQTQNQTQTQTQTVIVNQAPPQQQNRPPTVQILNKPQHDIDTDKIQICATENDPDGDHLAETWTAQHGTVSSPFHPDATNPDKVCTEYTPNDVPAGQTVQEQVVITVSDGQASGRDEADFPVVDDAVRPF